AIERFELMTAGEGESPAVVGYAHANLAVVRGHRDLDACRFAMFRGIRQRLAHDPAELMRDARGDARVDARVDGNVQTPLQCVAFAHPLQLIFDDGASLASIMRPQLA